MTQQKLPDALAQFLKQLPNEPGVYRMLNVDQVVLYVGKATSLKKRVSSYFTKQNPSAKTRSLVTQINTIEISITRSETEAFLLESNLIKALKPKYNVLMRDDKSYPYIHISAHPQFPSISIYRAKKKPSTGLFFGPYPNTPAVRQTVITIQKIFNVRNCRDSYFNARSRPCLQYQIKRCTAPCVGYIEAQAYQQAVQQAVRFLQGKSHSLLNELAVKMEDAVRLLHFEEAARLRDQIKNLRLVQEQQGMMQLQGDADAIAIDITPGFACIQCVSIRNGEIIHSSSFFPRVPEITLEDNSEYTLWEQTFAAFISFHYLETPQRIPAVIVTHHALADHSALEAVLSQARGKRCKIQVNPRGAKSRWVDFALNNLRLSLNEHHRKHATMQARYHALEHVLGLTQSIERMECFDISHTQGEATVASCVVFNQEGPWSQEYKRFNIEGITPGDDYAAMEQALQRRFTRWPVTPDVLLIDGGKGQVAMAEKVLDRLHLNHVLLLGIAKDPSRKAGLEKLIRTKPYREIILPPDALALHLLQHLRDEAHRFAITTHRKKRQKARTKSTLEDIEGIGPQRRRALLHRFGGLRDLVKAPLEEIAKVPGINAQLAHRIFQHFHG